MRFSSASLDPRLPTATGAPRGLSFAALALLGCAASGADGGGSGGASSSSSSGGECAAGTIVCEGNVARTCDGKGGFGGDTDCGTGDCAEGIGCTPCTPGPGSCKDGIGTACNADNTAKITFECDAAQGMQCTPDGCIGECSPATLGTSYLGCEYWPTVTTNAVWENAFQFAVAMGNAGGAVTTVQIEGPNFGFALELQPYEARTLNLPWVQPLKGEESDDTGSSVPPTANNRGGAYRLRSNHPIAAYQFNPLEYENANNPPTCPNIIFGKCYSFSNDASLLLPTNALTGSYFVVGYRTVFTGDLMAITATQDGTEVHITAGPHTKTLDGEGVLLNYGQETTATLGRGEVLQLFTKGTSTLQQWAGSQVTANHPVQVITGSPCAVVPDDTVACDHLEESVLPAETLGKDYVVSVPRTPQGLLGTPHGGRHAVRIHGAFDGTKLVYDPPGIATDTTLEAGQVIEIKDVVDDFAVSANLPFAVTEYMYGQGDPSAGDHGVGAGDPSQSIAIPTAQFRKSYTFVAPVTYETSFVNVIAPVGASIEIDGNVLSPDDFWAVGSSGKAVARVELAKLGGHKATSSEPFGIVVYAYGLYTSYMYPGGMDLRKIAPPVPE